MAAIVNTISVEQYLHTSYEHDPEFIDGVIKERPMPTRLHAFTQALLGHWFLLHMEEWKVMPMSEVRTRVQPARFRLPDIAVTPISLLSSSPLAEPPLIAIEILSTDDSFADLRERAADFATMGTAYIWLIDPEKQQAFTWTNAAWTPAAQLLLPGSPVHLDLNWLWSKLGELQ